MNYSPIPIVFLGVCEWNFALAKCSELSLDPRGRRGRGKLALKTDRELNEKWEVVISTFERIL